MTKNGIAVNGLQKGERRYKMVKIIADSTCDLSQKLIEKYDITILPLHVVLGEEDYLDGKNITPEDIYEYSDRYKTTPKTAAPGIGEAMDILKETLCGADGVVCFGISGDMSSSVNNMKLAAEELEAADRVFTVDSRNLSTGVGLLVLKAAQMAQAGISAPEIYESVTDIIPRVRSSFVVDTMTFLYRGGRCNGVAALLGTALKLHPMIVVEDGRMDVGKKYRGRYSNIIVNYAKDLENELLSAEPERVFITHSGCKEAVVNEVYTYLKELGYFKEIHITRAGGVISSHCGPGTLGVLFIAKSTGSSEI